LELVDLNVVLNAILERLKISLEEKKVEI
jgi:hypothetical protein